MTPREIDALIPRVLESVVSEADGIGTVAFLYEGDDWIIDGRAAVDGDIVYDGDEGCLLRASGTVYNLRVESVDGAGPMPAAEIERLRAGLDELFDRHIRQTYRQNL